MANVSIRIVVGVANHLRIVPSLWRVTFGFVLQFPIFVSFRPFGKEQAIFANLLPSNVGLVGEFERLTDTFIVISYFHALRRACIARLHAQARLFRRQTRAERRVLLAPGTYSCCTRSVATFFVDFLVIPFFVRTNERPLFGTWSE